MSPGPPAFLLASLLFLQGSAARGQGCPAECPAVARPSRSKVAPSARNPRYVVYAGKTRPLIGMSASYLCHVRQPGSFGSPVLTPAEDYCEITNYRSYLDSLGTSAVAGGSIPRIGLNKIRLWIGLDHSPGTMREGAPYPHETPFLAGGTIDRCFFDRLQCVLDYAWAKDVIVELTIFDPWQGDYGTSPWKDDFTDRACFASKDWVKANGKTCGDPADPANRKNRRGWAKQKELVSTLVTRFCGHPNVYYEVANEVDLTAAVGIAGLTPASVIGWHEEMTAFLAQRIAALGCGQLIAANLHDLGNLDRLSAAHKAVNAHYTAIAGPWLGANELIRARHDGGPAGLDRILGFGETRITTDASLFGTPLPDTFQSADAARAEAWEFLLSEGGVYDLYGERWRKPGTDTARALESLKVAHGLLLGLDLDRMRRSPVTGNAPPAWIAGLAPYQPDGALRWGAMESDLTRAGDANLLYLHHSALEGAGLFQRYRPAAGTYQETGLRVKLPAGTYLVEWISPTSGAILQWHRITIATAFMAEPLPASPRYRHDIALQITRN